MLRGFGQFADCDPGGDGDGDGVMEEEEDISWSDIMVLVVVVDMETWVMEEEVMVLVVVTLVSLVLHTLLQKSIARNVLTVYCRVHHLRSRITTVTVSVRIPTTSRIPIYTDSFNFRDLADWSSLIGCILSYYPTAKPISRVFCLPAVFRDCLGADTTIGRRKRSIASTVSATVPYYYAMHEFVLL